MGQAAATDGVLSQLPMSIVHILMSIQGGNQLLGSMVSATSRIVTISETRTYTTTAASSHELFSTVCIIPMHIVLLTSLVAVLQGKWRMFITMIMARPYALSAVDPLY